MSSNARWPDSILYVILPIILLVILSKPDTGSVNDNQINMPKKPFSTATLNTPTTVASSKHESTPQVPATFEDGLPLPRLFVFDLDYTLWPFWVDTHVSAPLKPATKDPSTPNTAMIDSHGEAFTFYREVPGILYAVQQKGISMGLASRSRTPDLAGVMLQNIVIPVPSSSKESEDSPTVPKPQRAWDFFKYREIYPGLKVNHFSKIQKATKSKEGQEGQIPYEDMIFFDDESGNRDVENKYGVTFVLIRNGVTRDEVDKGVREWRRRKGMSSPGTNDAADTIYAEDE